MSDRSALVAAVATNVVRLRKRRGWTAQRLADEVNLVGIPWDRGQVSKLETGRRQTLTLDELAALAVVLQVGQPWSLTTESPSCGVCCGAPPAGFSCMSCGTAG